MTEKYRKGDSHSGGGGSKGAGGKKGRSQRGWEKGDVVRDVDFRESAYPVRTKPGRDLGRGGRKSSGQSLRERAAKTARTVPVLVDAWGKGEIVDNSQLRGYAKDVFSGRLKPYAEFVESSEVILEGVPKAKKKRGGICHVESHLRGRTDPITVEVEDEDPRRAIDRAADDMTDWLQRNVGKRRAGLSSERPFPEI